VLLAEVAATSADVGATSARRAKTERLVTLLGEAGYERLSQHIEVAAIPFEFSAVLAGSSSLDLVVVIDTEITPALRAEGDARELQRAIQDLRKDAGLALDDRIALWVDGLPEPVAAHLDEVAEETLADRVERGPAPPEPAVTRGAIELSSGPVAIGLRRHASAGAE